MLGGYHFLSTTLFREKCQDKKGVKSVKEFTPKKQITCSWKTRFDLQYQLTIIIIIIIIIVNNYKAASSAVLF